MKHVVCPSAKFNGLRQTQWPAKGDVHAAFWLHFPQAAPITLTHTFITHKISQVAGCHQQTHPKLHDMISYTVTYSLVRSQQEDKMDLLQPLTKPVLGLISLTACTTTICLCLHLVFPHRHWPAWYNTCIILLTKLTPKGVVVSFLFYPMG